MSMTVHNYRHRQFHRTSNRENPSSGYRDMGSASLTAARPPASPPAARTVTTIPLQPGGLRGENPKASFTLCRKINHTFGWRRSAGVGRRRVGVVGAVPNSHHGLLRKATFLPSTGRTIPWEEARLWIYIDWLIEHFYYVTFWHSTVKTNTLIRHHTPVYDKKYTIKSISITVKTLTSTTVKKNIFQS